MTYLKILPTKKEKPSEKRWDNGHETEIHERIANVKMSWTVGVEKDCNLHFTLLIRLIQWLGKNLKVFFYHTMEFENDKIICHLGVFSESLLNEDYTSREEKNIHLDGRKENLRQLTN